MQLVINVLLNRDDSMDGGSQKMTYNNVKFIVVISTESFCHINVHNIRHKNTKHIVDTQYKVQINDKR